MPLNLITLDQAKQHLRIIGDDADDADLQLKINAATQMAVAYLDRAVYATQEDLDAATLAGTAGPCPLVATDMVRAGILLLLGDLYANREEVTNTPVNQLPTGAKACLRPLRRMGA